MGVHGRIVGANAQRRCVVLASLVVCGSGGGLGLSLSGVMQHRPSLRAKLPLLAVDGSIAHGLAVRNHRLLCRRHRCTGWV